jgi:hypothetical protein
MLRKVEASKGAFVMKESVVCYPSSVLPPGWRLTFTLLTKKMLSAILILRFSEGETTYDT